MRQKIVDLERQLIGERIAVIEECQAVLQTFPLEETSGTTNLNEIKALWEIMLSPLYVAALDALKNKP